MNAEVFKDTRLLEALELIDDKYIADAARYNMDYVPRANEVPVRTWKTPFKYWKQFTALAACVVLFAFSAPIFSYFSKVIGNWGAAAGSENSTEIAETPETTNGMYDEYILTEEDLAELNEAYFKRNILDNPEHTNMNEEELNRVKNSKYGKFAETVEQAMIRIIVGGPCYFGKFENSIVIAYTGRSFHCSYVIGNDVFEFPTQNILVCYDSTFYELDEAYELGFITEKDVKKIYELSKTYYYN
ncbi:MAG: hypothetical protein IJD70_01840 [Clostridia bacterium]|nr:hypothetical protein [Clostridia bacterium]